MIAVLRRIISEGVLYLANRIVARIPSHRVRLLFYRRVREAMIAVNEPASGRIIVSLPITIFS